MDFLHAFEAQYVFDQHPAEPCTARTHHCDFGHLAALSIVKKIVLNCDAITTASVV